ncbi:MAG: glycosyltransferase family 4 protein [Chloroflexi bacterium]|nr:glycosyltransferase family 4 protein [Anaerolineaceae bacterium]NMB88191.1 glycosyltransferase family 4 protein [Chloroflexota bacterium]
MSARLRVVMVIQAYAPLVGGAERQLGEVAPLLQAKGIDVQILTRRRDDLPDYEIIDGIPVHRLPARPPKPLAAAQFILSGMNKIRVLRPDVIHAFDMLSPTTIAVLSKMAFHIPAVTKVLLSGPNHGEMAYFNRTALGRQRLKVIRSEIDAFVTISAEIDAELHTAGIPKKARVYIPNGVDTQRFKPLDCAGEKQKLRHELGLPDGRLVLFVGRLEEQKRVDQLLAIWPTLYATHPDAHLLVIGSGSEEEPLKQLAGNGIHFLGVKEDVTAYLQAVDVFVLPSAAEGLSNALLEALSSGLAAVATDVGGNSEVVLDGRTGLLVPPDDPEALLAALVRLLEDPQACRQLGARAREHILTNYSLATTVNCLADLYFSLAQQYRHNGKGPL